MKRVLLLIPVALLAVGCASSPAHPASSAAAAPALPAGCAKALALLPPSVPSTQQQADAAMARLGGTHGTTLDALRDKVSADLLTLSFDLAEGGGVTQTVARYQADALALRSYCAS